MHGGRTDMSDPKPPSDDDDFLKAAASDRERGLVGEFLAFMAENKAWWMVPILVVLALFGLLFMVGGSAALPFLYSFF